MHGKLREQNFVELAGVFAEAPIGLCCFDTDLRFVFINNCLARLNGISVEEHLGRSIHEIIPDVAAGVEAQLRHVIETGEPIIGGAVDAETPAQLGLIRSFQHHYYAIKSEAGEVLKVACVVQDVTARKQAEEALDRARGDLERRIEERTRERSHVNRELEREITERRRTQDLYKTLLYSAPDPIVTVDRDGKIVVVNREVELVFGYDSEELIGQSVEMLLPEHLRGGHVRHRNDYFGDPRVRPMGAGLELVARCKDGRELPVEISLSPVQTTEGAFVTAVIRDITERKRAEEARRESDARLAKAAKMAKIGYWIWDEIEDKAIYCSDELAQICGVATGRELAAMLTSPEKDAKWVHPADRGRFDKLMRRSKAEKTGYDTEYRIVRPDGEVRYLREIMEPMLDDQGNFIRSNGIVQDVTEKKRVEEAVRTRDAWLRAILENAPIEIVLKDTEGRIMAISRNVADILGLEVNNFIGGTTADFLPDHIAAAYMAGDRKVLETGRPLQQEIVEEINGSTRYSLSAKFPLKDESGEITGICSITSDITDVKQAEVRLIDAIESISEGFVLYDADERFVLCNSKYRGFYPSIADTLKPGARLEDVARAAFQTGAVTVSAETVEAWVESRLRQDRAAQGTHEQQLTDGRWLLCSERRTSTGGAVGIRTDITERKKVELALHDHKERLRILLETTPAIPWEADAKTWKFTYIGPQAVELLGYPRERWLEQDFWVDHIHPEDRAWVADYCLNSSNQYENYEFEYRMIAADGRSVWLHDIVNVVRQNGELVALRGFMIDITERKQAEESLQDLSARLITAQEEERSRIARELHDDFNQRLALLAVDLERFHDAPPDSQECLVDGLASLLRRTKELSSDVHRLSHRLHPSVLEHLGLVVATRSLCKEISDQYGIHIELVHHGVPRALPGDVALCLYRIAQEALRNVIKHSGAESARVEITGTASELKLQISDSGTGFDLKSTRTRHGLGLLSMRERLRLVSGTISFERIEPTGTRIDVRIPFPGSDQR